MRTTNISLDTKQYYKNYYQKNKEYLRHRQRLRYYRNTSKFYPLLREYNKILLLKHKCDMDTKKLNKQKFNKNDTASNYIITFN